MLNLLQLAIATLTTVFGGSYLATSGKKATGKQLPPINASSKDEESFIQYVRTSERTFTDLLLCYFDGMTNGYATGSSSRAQRPRAATARAGKEADTRATMNPRSRKELIER